MKFEDRIKTIVEAEEKENQTDADMKDVGPVTPDIPEKASEAEENEDEDTEKDETGENFVLDSADENNPMELDVQETINDGADGQSVKGYIEDILKRGLSSGIVGSLIYYNDTVSWYDRFEDEIWDLLDEQYQEMGSKSILEFIGSLNGAKDVGSNDQFKNLLAWYAFEETTRKLAGRAGMDV